VVNFARTGLYTVPDAGRLLNEPPTTIRRWAFGYTRRGKYYEPPIHTDVPATDGVQLLTFLELVELMFIRGFLEVGLSWTKVRSAALTAARLLHAERHPFAMKKWFVDPAGIYLKLGKEHGEDILVEVAGDAQVAIEVALEPYLHQIEFDVSGVALRWYPLGMDRPVVLDPRRALGAPIVDSAGVPTDAIAEMHRAGETIPGIAAWYGLEEFEVSAALEFEEATLR
jgi:uncharacterized protein (DUF433 family)